MEKLTTSEVRKRVAKIHPGIKVLGKYKSSQAPLKCRCQKCKKVWNSSWNRLDHGSGCPRCGRESFREKMSLSLDEVRKRKPALKFTEVRGKLLVKCRLCGNEWVAKSLKSSGRCRPCGVKKAHDKTRLSIEEVSGLLKKIDPTLKILSKRYENAHEPLRCKCLQCGRVLSTTWNKLSSGYGCRTCKSPRMTEGEAVDKLRKMNPTIEIVEYRGWDHPTKFRCKKCEYEWVTSSDVLRGNRGCPRCAGVAPLSTSEVKKRLKSILSQVKILSEYKNSYTKMKCKCRECGHVWNSAWEVLCQGCGCSQCTPDWKSEEEVRGIIERLTKASWPKAKPSEVPFLCGLRADGYSRKFNAIFEFDGDQHDHVVPFFHGKGRMGKKRFIEAKRRDWRKNIQCWRHGVTLIRIPYRLKNKEEAIKAKLERAGLIPPDQVRN